MRRICSVGICFVGILSQLASQEVQAQPYPTYTADEIIVTIGAGGTMNGFDFADIRAFLDWVDDPDGDMTSNAVDQTYVGECAAEVFTVHDGTDTNLFGGMTFNGGKVILRPMVDARHNGVAADPDPTGNDVWEAADVGKAAPHPVLLSMVAGEGEVLHVFQSGVNFEIDGFEVIVDDPAKSGLRLRSPNGTFRVTRCIIHEWVSGSAGTRGVNCNAGNISTMDITVDNCLFYNVDIGVSLPNDINTANIINCSFFGEETTGSAGISVASGVSGVTIRNCDSYDFVNDYSIAATVTANNNVSGDTTAPGTLAATGILPGEYYVDTANDIYRRKEYASATMPPPPNALDAVGQSQSDLLLRFDLKNRRRAVGDWDIGADQFWTAAEEPLPLPEVRLEWDTMTPTSAEIDFSTGSTVSYTDGTTTINKTVANEYDATLTDLGGGFWKLDVTNKKTDDLAAVYFPYDPSAGVAVGPDGDATTISEGGDDFILVPYFLGVALKADNTLKRIPNDPMVTPTTVDWSWELFNSNPDFHRGEYPGNSFSPITILADGDTARVVAAVNWSTVTGSEGPRICRIGAGKHRQTIRYEDAISQNSSDTFHAQYGLFFKGADNRTPWTKAVEPYQRWLKHKMAANDLRPDFPAWQADSHGFLAVLLSEFSDTELMQEPPLVDVPVPHQYIQGLWDTAEDEYLFNWVQFWGQMTKAGGSCTPNSPADCTTNSVMEDATDACGCCDLLRVPNSRFSPTGAFDLDTFAGDVTSAPSNAHIGFYTRPIAAGSLMGTGLDSTASLPSCYWADPMISETGLEWLNGWITEIETFVPDTNAYYYDVIGAKDFGRPLFVAELFSKTLMGDLANDGLIEGAVDIYPAAYLNDGSIYRDSDTFRGARDENDCEATLDNLLAGNIEATILYPEFGTYLLNDRIHFNGQTNSQGLSWGNTALPLSASADPGANPEYWGPRQTFNLGHKYNLFRINYDGTAEEYIIHELAKLAIDLRECVSWWSRDPLYQHDWGISNVSSGITVRRFLDKNGDSLLVVDHYDYATLPAQQFDFGGSTLTAPESRIAIYDTQNSTWYSAACP